MKANRVDEVTTLTMKKRKIEEVENNYCPHRKDGTKHINIKRASISVI